MIFLTSGGVNLGEDWGVYNNGVNLGSIFIRENIIYLGRGGVLFNGCSMFCIIKDFNGKITCGIWFYKWGGTGYNVTG